MNRLRIVLVPLVVVTGLVVTKTAASADSTEADQLASIVHGVAPVTDLTPLSVTPSGSALTASSSSLDIEIPGDPDGDVTVDDGSEDLFVGLPTAVDADDPVVTSNGKNVVYPAQADQTALVVQPYDEGLRINVVINDSASPEDFTFPVGVPTGGSMEILEDGGVVVLDPEGFPVGYMSKPWAKDATGESIPTHYTISGSSIVQHVAHDQAGTTYPVVADPFLGKSLISKTAWEWRSGGWTLKVSPTKWARANGPANWSYYVGTLGWKELYKKKKRQGLNVNLGGMRDQFICHQEFAFYKSTWNLDENRPNVSYAKTVRKLCNP